MSKTQIDFRYESRLGTELYARTEALDFDQAVDMIQKFSDWCDSNGFTIRHIEINDYETKAVEI